MGFLLANIFLKDVFFLNYKFRLILSIWWNGFGQVGGIVEMVKCIVWNGAMGITLKISAIPTAT